MVEHVAQARERGRRDHRRRASRPVLPGENDLRHGVHGRRDDRDSRAPWPRRRHTAGPRRGSTVAKTSRGREQARHIGAIPEEMKPVADALALDEPLRLRCEARRRRSRSCERSGRFSAAKARPPCRAAPSARRAGRLFPRRFAPAGIPNMLACARGGPVSATAGMCAVDRRCDRADAFRLVRSRAGRRLGSGRPCRRRGSNP